LPSSGRRGTVGVIEDRRFQVLLLPGSVLPASLAYPALIEELGERAEAIPLELQVYASAEPPADYSLDTEADGLLREAAARGFELFHLVGYSGGGAAALAFAATHGERLLSLALLEPAWAGNERTPPEAELYDHFRTLDQLPPDQRMAEFTRLQLAPGVEPPPRPDGPPPPWLAKRPAGIQAFLRTFDATELELDALRRFTKPVYFALGGRSNPDYFAEIAGRLDAVFPDFTVETFPDRHHFDPPHRVEPERLATSLLALWQRAERDDGRS
jgi:pimeloyl-ACP methyl ester carboxylesterase